MSASEPDNLSLQPAPLLTERFDYYYNRRLAGEEAQNAFAEGGERGYRRYIEQCVYAEMTQLYGHAYGRDLGQRGRFIIVAADARATDFTFQAESPARPYVTTPRAVVSTAPRTDVIDDTAGAPATSRNEPPEDDDPVVPADTGENHRPDLGNTPASPKPDTSVAALRTSVLLPNKPGAPNGTGPTAAELTRREVLYSELDQLRTAYARSVAEMRASADSELARQLLPNQQPVSWQQRVRWLGQIAINPRQYFRGREQIRRTADARDAYVAKLAEYLEAQHATDRAMVRSDEVAGFEAAVEDRWRLMLNASDPQTVPPADRAGIRQATEWLDEQQVWRVGRFAVQRSVAIPALAGGALLGLGAGVAVLTASVWGPVLAGVAAAGATGRWVGAARAATVNKYQFQYDDFRQQTAAAVQARRASLPTDPADTAGSTLANEAAEQYEATTREITRVNLTRLLGAEAAGAAVAEVGFVTVGLVTDGVGHLLYRSAISPYTSGGPSTRLSSPNHRPTPTPNYGTVNISASPWEVAKQLGSSDPIRAVQSTIAQFNLQNHAQYQLVNNAFGLPGEQIVNQAAHRLLTPAQQADFNRFMLNLARLKPKVFDP